jgi:hypothetical protein
VAQGSRQTLLTDGTDLEQMFLTLTAPTSRAQLHNAADLR